MALWKPPSLKFHKANLGRFSILWFFHFNFLGESINVSPNMNVVSLQDFVLADTADLYVSLLDILDL